MKVLYAKALVKDLEAVARNPGVKKRLLKLIEELKKINALEELHNIKKIEGYDNYYRLRVGDFRLGLKLSGNTVESASCTAETFTDVFLKRTPATVFSTRAIGWVGRVRGVVRGREIPFDCPK